MMAKCTFLILGMLMVYAITFSVLTFHAQTGESEGRPRGMKYSAVLEEVNEYEHHLIDGARRFDIDPRMLGCAIAAERAHNFSPGFEDYIDAVFGTSVGFAQVNMASFKRVLPELFNSDTGFFQLSDSLLRAARSYFQFMLGLKRYQRKFVLLLNGEANTAAAAMILRRSMERYHSLAPAYGIFHRPDLAATLYHRTFPDTLRGQPDAFGRLALRFYHDALFMPHAPPLADICNE